MRSSTRQISFSVSIVIFFSGVKLGCTNDQTTHPTRVEKKQQEILSEMEFALHSTTDVGEEPHSLAVADFNDDGIGDLAVANMGDHTVSILIGYGIDGRGLGIFEESGVNLTGPTPFHVTTADLDNDNRVDILTANKNGRSITVFWGQGDGTFPESQEIFINSFLATPTQVVSADLTGDGILDIVTSNGEESSIAFIRGLGDRKYATPRRIAVGLPGAGPAALTAADFNGDARLDLAVANWHIGKVSVLLQSSQGGVESKQNFITGEKQLDIAAADIDNDGITDLVTPSITDNAVYVLKGIGDGSFHSAVCIGVGNAPVGVAPADMNQDGIMDLVVTERDDFAVSVLFGDSGNAQGGLTFTRRETIWVGKKPVDTVVFDTTGDDILDMAVVNRDDGTVDEIQTVTDGCTSLSCTNTVPEICSQPNLARIYRYQWTVARQAVARIWDTKVNDCDKGEEFANWVIEKIYAMEARIEQDSTEENNCRIIGLIDGALVGLDIVQEYCGLYCFLSGNVVGTIAAKAYCELAIETNGAINAEQWVRQPVNICGLHFEIACETTFLTDTLSYVNELGACQPYTEGDYLETWDNSREKSCDYSLNEE